MRAGKMDRVIQIETYSSTQDEYGGEVISWLPLATVRAEVIQQSGDEFLAAGGVLSSLAVIFRTRFIEGASVMSRVTFEGRYFNLVEIKEIGRRQGIELRGVAAGEAPGPSLDFSDPNNSMYIPVVF